MEIRSSKDFISFIGETMTLVRKGEISPSAGNAVANLGGKVLQMISLEMRAMNQPGLADRKALQIEASK